MMSGGAAAAMEQGCWCTLEGAYFPFLHAGMVRPLAEAGVEWWHNHFLAIDYGYGKSSSSVGLYVRGPAELRPANTIPGVRLSPPTPSRIPHRPHPQNRRVDRAPRPRLRAGADGDRNFSGSRTNKASAAAVVAAYLDPANFKDIGDGHTIADQINEVLEPWDVVCERASNDRLGGWQLLYRMLRTGEFEITDVCPRSFEALRTRMHDEKRPGDLRKVPGDPLDDVADETRYALYTFIQQSTQPRELTLLQAVQRARPRLRHHTLAAKVRRAGRRRRTPGRYSRSLENRQVRAS